MNKNRHSGSCVPWLLKDARNRTNVFGQHEGGGKKGRERKKRGGKYRKYKNRGGGSRKVIFIAFPPIDITKVTN